MGHRQQGWGALAPSPDPALSPLCLRPGVLLEQRLLFPVASGGLPARSSPSTGLSSQECGDRTGSSGHPGGPGATRGEGARQEPAPALWAWASGPGPGGRGSHPGVVRASLGGHALAAASGLGALCRHPAPFSVTNLMLPLFQGPR